MDNKLSLLPAVLIVLVLLYVLFYLGVLSPANPQSNNVATMGSTGAMYHSYNPLAANGFLALIIGALIFFWALGDLSEKAKEIIPKVLVLAGVILLFMSLFNFVFGLHDMLTFTTYELTRQPSFGQQYGWLVQFFVYGVFGIILLYTAEYLRKEAGEKKSLLYTATLPLGVFMLLSAFVVFTMGFHQFLYNTNYKNYAQSLSWIIETFIYGVSAYALLWFSEKIRKREGISKSIFSAPASYMGMAFLLLALAAYIFGTVSYVYNDYTKDANWVIESVVFGVLGVGFTLVGDKIYLGDGEESKIFSDSMLISGGVLLAISILIFIAGFNDFLYSYSPNMKWILELVLLLIPGAIALAAGELTGRKNKTAAPEQEKPRRKEKAE